MMLIFTGADLPRYVEMISKLLNDSARTHKYIFLSPSVVMDVPVYLGMPVLGFRWITPSESMPQKTIYYSSNEKYKALLSGFTTPIDCLHDDVPPSFPTPEKPMDVMEFLSENPFCGTKSTACTSVMKCTSEMDRFLTEDERIKQFKRWNVDCSDD